MSEKQKRSVLSLEVKQFIIKMEEKRFLERRKDDIMSLKMGPENKE